MEKKMKLRKVLDEENIMATASKVIKDYNKRIATQQSQSYKLIPKYIGDGETEKEVKHKPKK